MYHIETRQLISRKKLTWLVSIWYDILLKGVFEQSKIQYPSFLISFLFNIWSFQFTVRYRKTSNFTIYFLKLMYFFKLLFVSYKRFNIITKETGFVLVFRSSAELIFPSSLLQQLVIGLFKIYSNVLSELLWITAKWFVAPFLEFFHNLPYYYCFQNILPVLDFKNWFFQVFLQKSAKYSK